MSRICKIYLKFKKNYVKLCGMEELNQIIAKNICEYRKRCNLTQSELASMVNFSDKSVSKWERGESIPDIYVLMNLCKIFEINIDDLVSKHKTYKRKGFFKRNKILIPIISAGLVWLLATLVFVSFILFFPDVKQKWLCYIYAIPVSTIVLLVFACLWGKRWMVLVFESILVWTVLLSICLTAQRPIWYLLLIGVPLQVLFVLWFFMKMPKKEKPIQ